MLEPVARWNTPVAGATAARCRRSARAGRAPMRAAGASFVDALGVAPGERLGERIGQLPEDEAPLLHDLGVPRPAEILVRVGREHEALGILREQRAPFRQ